MTHLPSYLSLAYAASITVGLRSKEKLRTGIVNVLRVRKMGWGPKKDRGALLAPFLRGNSVLLNPMELLAMRADLCFLWLFLVNPSASRAELMMMTVSDIVSQLITAHEKGSDVNLNK